MDPKPIHDEQILAAIESCRPGSDDVRDPALAFLAAELSAQPELKDLFGRIQQLDAQLGVSFRKVPVPEGLQQRLLERLEAARCEPTSDAAAAAVASDKESPVVAVSVADPSTASIWPSRRFPSRRRLLSIAGIFSAAAALLVAVWIHLYSAQPYTESVVLEQARALFMAEASGGPSTVGGGYLLSDPAHPAPSDMPLSRSLARVPGIKWREISGFLGSRGVAYDMPGGRATLYVVRRSVGELPSRPPLSPASATGGYCAAAWQNGGLLCVLVVRGDIGAYRDCITPPGPLT